MQLLCTTVAALVLSWWADAGKPGQQLALALDASTLSDRFTVLCISVLYRGCAIPVAWAIVPAWGKGAWKPIWLDLFDLLAESVPSDWTVLVLADRGLYARWLPLLRCQATGGVDRCAVLLRLPVGWIVP